MLCQLKANDATDATDTDLLTDTIESTMDDPDFFLRKAIGWALRQFARTDPGWVRHFVDTHPPSPPSPAKKPANTYNPRVAPPSK